MRKSRVLALLSLALIPLLLCSCALGGLFTDPPTYEPAIQANKAQAASYDELRNAFVAVVNSDPNATAEQRTVALADIEANRTDFYGFNAALEQFLAVVGEIKAERLLTLATEFRAWREAQKEPD